MKAMIRRHGLIALALVFFAATGAQAQDNYPNKPIRMIVASAAGTGPDANGRELAEELTKALGQTVFVDDRPGASGIIGTDLVAKAPPDGYTLYFGSNTVMAVLPHLYKKLPFSVEKDFAAVGRFGILNVGLLASTHVEAKDVSSLITDIKAHPDAFNVATLGIGSVYHVTGEWFSQVTGLKLNYVPYNSNSPYADLVGGQVQLIFDALPIAGGLVRANKLKLLAISGNARHPAFPDTPTFAEAGLPTFEPLIWNGLYAPAGTPPKVIAILNAAMHKAVQNPTLKQRWMEQGGELKASTPAEFAEFTAASREAWGKVILKSGITLD